MRIAALVVLTISTIGCMSSNRLPMQNASLNDWQIGGFRVGLQAKSRDLEDKSYFIYNISYSALGEHERELVMESAHTLGGFSSVTNGDPKNWIRIIQDPNGRALLIEEEIPNECGPCSNYLWVHLDTEGHIEGTYLQLSSKVTGPPEGINYEYPKVISLDGNILRYGYTVGTTVSKRIDQIEKSDHPTQP
jgi:hypothetical protein